MLKQASVRQIQKGQITKQQGYIVVAMCFYPRGLKKDLLDEYRSDLAPDRELFEEFKTFQAEVGHEAAFEKSNYQKRFHLRRRALDHLKSLVELSKEKDVYLACQCEIGERCHREILLLIAEKRFGAQVDPLSHEYQELESRLDEIFSALLKEF